MILNGRYTFIGQDSLGYVHGKTYYLTFHPWLEDLRGWSHGTARFAIKRIHIKNIFFGNGFCPYQTETAFWQNWRKS